MPLQWNGDELVRQVEEAARRAVDATVDAAADEAERSHVWQNRTRQLEEEIRAEHAAPDDPNPTARFGTTERRGFVGLFHEEGTVHEFERPFLRPAADITFPSLASRVREELDRG